MVHTALEDHLNEFCPKCKEKHDKTWKSEFSEQIGYITITCQKCEYVIYKKKQFMSCGKIA